jgi:hypothetical protein
VDVLEEEAGVERGEVLESNPAIVGVPASERPRDEAIAPRALGGALPEQAPAGAVNLLEDVVGSRSTGIA